MTIKFGEIDSMQILRNEFTPLTSRMPEHRITTSLSVIENLGKGREDLWE